MPGLNSSGATPSDWDVVSSEAAPAPTSATSTTSTTSDPWAVTSHTPVPDAQTARGAAQATASGLNSGAADLLGLPVDTARNIMELSKVVPGFVYHQVTGKNIPDALQPESDEDKAKDIGSSDWIKQQLRNIEGTRAVDTAEDTHLNRVLHGASEAVPSAFVGGEANSAATAARTVAGGAVAGAASQEAAEQGLGTAGQAIAGLAGGAAAARVGVPRTAPGRVQPSNDRVAPPTAGGGFAADTAPSTPAPEPGAPPKLKVSGSSTASDQAERVPLPELKPASTEGAESAALPADEQATREQTLRNIGLKETRESAITGDTKATGTDFQTSKLDNDAGNRMSAVIDNERGALQKYASDITDASGGTRGTDSPSLYQRGATISQPIEELGDYFDKKIKQTYAAADEKAQGLPIEMPTTNKFIGEEKSQFLGTVEGKQLLEGVTARMKDLGLTDQYGSNVKPATVDQAERLKQYLGDQWTPRTSRLIGQLKSSIDDDVTRAAGTDLYKDARATRALRATLLDDPKGIARLAPPDDRLGLNRSVPLENVPDYVTGLPVDQFGHVVKTLRTVPAEVQPSAAAALNEIRAHFANRLEAAGNTTQSMWNVKGANEFLRKNQLKMAEVYSPQEMAQFKTLHDAGHILRMDRTYPGAAAQGHNLVARGALKIGEHASSTGMALGTFAHPGVGTALGAGAGWAVKAGANKIANKSSTSSVEKRIRKLQ